MKARCDARQQETGISGITLYPDISQTSRNRRERPISDISSPTTNTRCTAASAAHLVKTHAPWHIDEPAFLCRLSSAFCPCHDPILGLEPASRRRRRPRLVRYRNPARRRLRHVRLRHARRRVFRLWRARGPAYSLSETDFAALRESEPAVAIKILAGLGRELSGRLRRANRTIHQLEA